MNEDEDEIPFKRKIKELKLHSIEESELSGCGCTPKVLIVDDNDFNILPLVMVLENQLDIDTEKAQNGLQAVNMFINAYKKPCKCQNRGYKLILMDI